MTLDEAEIKILPRINRGNTEETAVNITNCLKEKLHRLALEYIGYNSGRVFC
jgi:hypothetical protein